jgi:hypothetical protein
MKLIPLTKGYFAQVDDADFEWLNQWKWQALTGKKRKTVYAVRSNGKSMISMHRQILGLTDPKVLGEHEDNNGLNNQRENLRIATQSQNAMNNRLYNTSKTGYKGVCMSDKPGVYRAYIVLNYKQKSLGMSDCPETCARTYNKAAKEMFGEFAKLNDVPDGPFCEPCVIQSNNSTGFRGIVRNGKNWVVSIGTVGKQRFNFGTYSTKEEAAFIYNLEAVKLHGDRAVLNDLSGIDTSGFSPGNALIKAKPTEFNGVATKRNGFRALIYFEKKQIALGGFKTAEAAARAYDAKAIELFGASYTKLNFKPETPETINPETTFTTS